jgi:hypothetical protein
LPGPNNREKRNTCGIINKYILTSPLRCHIFKYKFPCYYKIYDVLVSACFRALLGKHEFLLFFYICLFNVSNHFFLCL